MTTGDAKLLDSLKRVTIELKGTRERLRTLEERQSEPIAIVGMSCRYPGEARSPQSFWRMLAAGSDAIGPQPQDRGWFSEASEASESGTPAADAAPEGGFVKEATCFDAPFFGIHPAEARLMDPQQRLLLEAAWEACEDAGVDPLRLRGSRTGVYAGVMHHDYGAASGAADLEEVGMTGGSIVSGRVAYALDLQGPAVTVDTACSSSLVAIHLACQALRGGECEMALAGGVTVLSTPFVFAVMGEAGGLAADGRCKSFDAAADGTGFSEGAGLLVLERLSEARRNGHEPIALIRGTATNQDGASNGLSAPNGPSQERVIRQALANAGLSPSEVDAVEAHGTGTVLGDPIEANALLATYGQDRGEAGPLRLGSVKSNIGHAQAAAGVAGVIKMALAMRNGLLPKSLHLGQPTPHVDWEASEVELLSEAQPWETNGRPRRAGVSSFGFSGTNAHLILEEAPDPEAVEGGGGEEQAAPPVPLLLSAKGEAALREMAARLRAHMRERPEETAAEVARSLVDRRPRLDLRAAVAGASRDEILDGLEAIAGGRDAENAFVAPAPTGGRPSAPILLFPGQGSQWRSMAVDLLASSPPFAAAIDECEQALEPHLDWSLGALLRREEGAADLERLDVVQPALFAMSVALASLWRASGVEPAGVVGHSQGEIAAVHVAGGLSLDDAARLIALRSQVMIQGAGEGGMALVASSPDALSERIPTWPELVSLAGVNSPGLIVLSGPTDGIEEALRLCEEAGIWHRWIKAAVGPGHSPAVERVRPLLLDAAAGITPRSGDLPFYSSVAASRLDTADLDAEYWYRNAREPVMFGPAVSHLLEQGHRRFIEVSPNPILAFAMHESFSHDLGDAAAEASFTGTLRHRHGAPSDFALAVGTAWANGVEVDLDAAVAPAARRASLPTYPFQRQHYWLEPPASAGAGAQRGQPAAVASEGEAEESIVEQFASMPEGDRADAALEFVMQQLAAALGYDSHDSFDPDRPFLELGFDSLTALQYRNRLNRTTGLDLAISVALDYPTPQALAGFLLSQLQAGAAAQPGSAEGTLQPLLQNAIEHDRAGELAALLQDLASFRPSFASADEIDEWPSPVCLADGDALPALLCVPSVVPSGGPHEYSRLAAAVGASRQVSSLSWPGFTAGDRVPASSSVAIDFQVAAIQSWAAAGPLPALVGHSSGGAFAYAVAQCLERQGSSPAAVVLIDSYHPRQVAFEAVEDDPDRAIGLRLFGQLLGAERVEAEVGDARLSAAMYYLRLLGEVEVEPISAPVLLVRAAEPVAADAELADWRPQWDVPHEVVETAGTHLTMMNEHASTTAEAICAWLDGALGSAEKGMQTNGRRSK